MDLYDILEIFTILAILEGILYTKYSFDYFIVMNILISAVSVFLFISRFLFTPKIKYDCKNNICNKVVGGSYDTIEDCKKANKCYKCNYGKNNRNKKLEYTKNCQDKSTSECNNYYSYISENNKKKRRACNSGTGSKCIPETESVYSKRFVQDCNLANGNKDDCHKYYSLGSDNKYYKCFYTDNNNKNVKKRNTCNIGKLPTSKLPDSCPNY